MPTASTILAIETSCDDTSVAICRNNRIVANVVASQRIHSSYGGVVPELASRAHIERIVPTLATCLKQAQCTLADVDGFAYTAGPGLMGSLLVGVEFTKSLAMVYNKPLIAVHHIDAHIIANLIEEPKPSFPFLCLTVSGGHTQIAICHHPLSIEIIGQTLDDSAGEAFDKAAKMLGLDYPGGPLIDQLAKGVAPYPAQLPTPKVARLNFSFSGLKTAFLYFLQKQVANNPSFIAQHVNPLCALIQQKIVQILMDKLIQAAQQTQLTTICIAGGVSANSLLRAELHRIGQEQNWQTFIPAFEYCTDNAAMIAQLAHYKYVQQHFANLSDVAYSHRS